MNPSWAGDKYITKWNFVKVSIIAVLSQFPMAVMAEESEGTAPVSVAMGPSFAGWLVAFRKEASVKGISETTLDKAFVALTPLDKLIDFDRRQPEFSLPFEVYLKRVAKPDRIRRGAQKMIELKPVLAKIEAKYGVPGSMLVALWGIESDYGRLAGTYSVVQSLATLAYEGRRATFFRGELLNALKILDAGHVEPKAMLGSWAGAMGQTQFMPSTFLNYAVDFSGDGRIDVWNSTEDALASGANYLAKIGWKSGESWGREVKIPADLDPTLLGGKVHKTLKEWAALGIKKSDGHALPDRDLQAGLIVLNGKKQRAFLTYSNFDAIHEWNRSLQFATSVGLIADTLAKSGRNSP